jgi:hypothetical protein
VVVAVVGEIHPPVGMAVAAGAVVQILLAGQEITHLEVHLKEIMEELGLLTPAQAQHTA